GQAVPALPRLLGQERALQRVGSAALAEPFDRHHRPAVDRPQRKVARRGGVAVDEHEARAAQPRAASEARALQPKVIAQDVDQRSRRLRVAVEYRSVDTQPYRHPGHPQSRTLGNRPLSRSVPTIPSGKNSSTKIIRLPVTTMFSWVVPNHAIAASLNSTRSVAPITGPATVPRPPMITMSTISAAIAMVRKTVGRRYDSEY